jgi:hypothetical protein
MRMGPGGASAAVGALRAFVDQLDGKLAEFDAALAAEPRTLDRARADYLEMLARYSRQLAAQAAEIALATVQSETRDSERAVVWQRVLRLTTELSAKAEAHARRAWEQRFTWAAADGHQLRQHHLPALRRLLGLLAESTNGQRNGHATAEKNTAIAQGPLAQVSSTADRLWRWAVTVATSRRLFPGCFQDDEGRDTLGKLGMVKKLIAQMATQRYLIETLAAALAPAPSWPIAEEQAELIQAAAADALVRMFAAAEQLPGFGEEAGDASLAGPADAAGCRRRGGAAVHRRLLTLPGEDRLFEQLAQRQALQAELEELRGLQVRLEAVREEVQRAGCLSGPASAEIGETLARQEAQLLAGKLLLLRTHARLERCVNSEVETVLLRIWLAGAAAALEECERSVREALGAASRAAERPVVEPGSGPPPTKWPDYLSAPAHYETGDFLALPVDLLRPRLVPEMVEAPSRAAPSPLLLGRAASLVYRMHDEIQCCRALASSLEGQCAAAANWQLRRMADACFAAEAVAWDVAGLGRHPGTKSQGLERAIRRVFLRAMLRLILTAGGEIRGQAGRVPPLGSSALVAQLYILKQVTGSVAPRWSGGGGGPKHLARAALELEALRSDLHELIGRALDLFGASLWQDPNVRASAVRLADAALWFKAADSVLGRLAWLSRRSLLDEDAEPCVKSAVAHRVLGWCARETRSSLRRFEGELAELRRGYYAPEVRAAVLLFQRAGYPPSGAGTKGPSEWNLRPPAGAAALRRVE